MSDAYPYKVFGFVKDCGDGSTAIEWVGEEQLATFTFYCENEDEYNDGDGFTQKETLQFPDRSSAEAHGIVLWDEVSYIERTEE